MSKSWENCIWVDDAPSDMYGKVMRIDDDMLTHYFTLATDVEEGEIEDIQRQLESGENPRDIKQRLAREIVSVYHGETAARQAEDAFVRQFQNKELPEDIPETPLSRREWELVDLLVATELAGSKSQARRLVGQGGIRINGEQLQKDRVTVADGDVLQAGKRHFRKIRL